MSHLIKLASVAAALTLLTACVETTGDTRPSAAAPAPGTVTPAEQACLRDVTSTTNNPDVVLLSSSFSQAGSASVRHARAGAASATRTAPPPGSCR
jgi:hypothetical protein